MGGIEEGNPPSPIIFRKLVKNLDSWPKLDKNVGFNEKKEKFVIFYLLLDINDQKLIKKWLKLTNYL